MAQNQIIVDPNGGTVALTITGGTVYTTVAEGTTVSFPQTISAVTSYFVKAGSFACSATIAGVTVLNTTVKTGGSNTNTVTCSAPRVDSFVPVRTGTGTPEAAVTAPVGSLYTDSGGSTGTTLYVKETGAGNTGWVAK